MLHVDELGFYQIINKRNGHTLALVCISLWSYVMFVYKQCMPSHVLPLSIMFLYHASPRLHRYCRSHRHLLLPISLLLLHMSPIHSNHIHKFHHSIWCGNGNGLPSACFPNPWLSTVSIILVLLHGSVRDSANHTQGDDVQ